MPPLLVLVGATASGKSAAAVPVARALDAEILSLDSMLLYRGMEIGTDKPRDRGGVPHHLIDLLDPAERFDLARYIALADEAIREIHGRGRRVLVVGGTGLYLMGLLKGIFAGAPRDAALRESLAGEETELLHRRLAEKDGGSAAKIHPHDRRRILRALEVLETTGRPILLQQEQFRGPDRHPSILAGIARSREDLHARIRARVDAMFSEGLVEEVSGLRLGPTAGQAVGYKEVAAALRGEYDLGEAKRRVVRHTIRLVRRQETWFRKFPVRWVEAAPGEGPAELAPRLLAVYRGSTIE